MCHIAGKKTAESEQSSDEEDIAAGRCDGSHSNGSTEENNMTNSEEEDTTATMSSKMNYFMVVNEKSKIRTEMEHTAANGQKKQAVEVNKTESGKVVKQYLREQCAY